MKISMEKEPSPKATSMIPTWKIIIDEYQTELEKDFKIKMTRLMMDRQEYGYEKHGVNLTPNNGRNNIVDAIQEGLDLMVYIRNNMRVSNDSLLSDAYQASIVAVELLLLYKIKQETI